MVLKSCVSFVTMNCLNSSLIFWLTHSFFSRLLFTSYIWGLSKFPLVIEFQFQSIMIWKYARNDLNLSVPVETLFVTQNVSLPQVELYCPCQEARLTNLLQIALVGFCSLKTLCSALEDESENDGLSISSPRAKSVGPHSLMQCQGKVVSQSCIPGPCVHWLLTWLWLSLSVSGTWSSFGSLNPADSWGLLVGTAAGRERGWEGSRWFITCWASAQRVVMLATPSWEPTPGLADCPWLPHSDAWELCHIHFCPHSVFLRPHCTVLPRVLPPFCNLSTFKQGCPSLE